MCRELKREPLWVAVIRLALLRGRVGVDGVLDETNLDDGYARTARDVLETMAERNLLQAVPSDEGPDVYLQGSVLRAAAPDPGTDLNVSESGAHRWGRTRS